MRNLVALLLAETAEAPLFPYSLCQEPNTDLVDYNRSLNESRIYGFDVFPEPGLVAARYDRAVSLIKIDGDIIM